MAALLLMLMLKVEISATLKSIDCERLGDAYTQHNISMNTTGDKSRDMNGGVGE